MSSVRQRQTGIERTVGPCDSRNLKRLFCQELIGDAERAQRL